MNDTSARRRSTYGALAAAVALVASMALAVMAQAGTVIASGFEADDGNLTVESTVDWNSFATTTWTGTAPYRESTKTASGWQFKGFEDAAALNTDTAFSGGVKQDLDCPGTNAGKAPNKDDLERIYLSSKDVPGFDDGEGGTESHTILNLAWVRIPQNTTSASAHVAFEFNKGENGACGGTSPLDKRTAGDMLVVYDFEGGATEIPTITLRRWVTSGACEVGSSSPPCWGPAVNLTTLGYAEAKVFVGTSTFDGIAPTPENVGDREFGEAGLDLTAAGVFTPGVCEAFGSVTGASRSSGNSGTAQMKDRVGPGDFTLTNCGTVTIIKQTNPRGVDQDFSFTSTLAGTEISCTTDTTPAAFTLNDNGNTTGNSTGNTETCTNVPAGSYTVTEGADPTGFAFASLTCSATGTGTSVTPNGTSTSTRVASITIAGGGSVTCTYVNDQQLGAIKITKTETKDDTGLAGAKFSITSGGTAITGSPFTTDANGEICVDDLSFGDYVVTETEAPEGYNIDDATGHTVTVDNNAACDDATYVGETIAFEDTPLSEIQVQFRSLAGEGVTAASIVCTDEADAVVDPVSENGQADPAFDDTDETITDLLPGTYTCTVVVDP
jgi:hypothetical protein